MTFDALAAAAGRLFVCYLRSIGSQAPAPRKANRLLALGLLLVLLGGCVKDDARAELQRQAEQAIAAVSERNHGDLMELLASDFAGPEGLDRDGASQMARLYFFRFRAIRVVAGPLDVSLQGQRGSVSFVAALTGGQGGLLPEQAQAWRVETDWRHDDGDWKLIAARWQPVVR